MLPCTYISAYKVDEIPHEFGIIFVTKSKISVEFPKLQLTDFKLTSKTISETTNQLV